MRTAIILAMLMAALAGPVGALSSSPPRDGRPVLVLASGGIDAEALITRAGGYTVGPLRAPLAVIALGESGFVEKLDSHEGLILIDALAIAKICGVGP